MASWQECDTAVTIISSPDIGSVGSNSRFEENLGRELRLTPQQTPRTKNEEDGKTDLRGKKREVILIMY
ncbi:hypothetical protein SKAU_G00133090 [Synaphobranchus kaupii]|uniref:Uncharacterized protein n=1 Tax=Synaphobranchus kaupii TaxID=118154 RepID=A0A9Q1FRS9_SYNKA|nr:hypothetical protein SKAU_G00133090 [Synaphobranchus kaupii]